MSVAEQATTDAGAEPRLLTSDWLEWANAVSHLQGYDWSVAWREQKLRLLRLDVVVAKLTGIDRFWTGRRLEHFEIKLGWRDPHEP